MGELDDESMQAGKTIIKFLPDLVVKEMLENFVTEEGELITIPVSSKYTVVRKYCNNISVR